MSHRQFSKVTNRVSVYVLWGAVLALWILAISFHWQFFEASLCTANRMSGPFSESDGWALNTTVKYRFTLSNDQTFTFTSGAKAQMREAFNAWNYENAAVNQLNCTGITFSETNNVDEAKIQIVPIDTGGVGVFVYNSIGSTFESTDIEINVNYPGSTSPNFYKKAILHEVGHTMGLNDAPQTQVAGRSVMNNGYSITPDSIQPCDRQSINHCPIPCGEPTRQPCVQPSDCCSGSCNGGTLLC